MRQIDLRRIGSSPVFELLIIDLDQQRESYTFASMPTCLLIYLRPTYEYPPSRDLDSLRVLYAWHNLF